MDRETLESYRSMLAEIAELRSKLENLKDDENLIDTDTVLDYRTGKGVPCRVVKVNKNRYWSKWQQYKSRMEELREECDRIEEWVEQIQDSMTRRIFRMIYIDGKSQAAAGKAINLDRSRISRRITEYLRQEQTGN